MDIKNSFFSLYQTLNYLDFKFICFFVIIHYLFIQLIVLDFQFHFLYHSFYYLILIFILIIFIFNYIKKRWMIYQNIQQKVRKILVELNKL